MSSEATASYMIDILLCYAICGGMQILCNNAAYIESGRAGQRKTNKPQYCQVTSPRAPQTRHQQPTCRYSHLTSQQARQ